MTTEKNLQAAACIRRKTVDVQVHEYPASSLTRNISLNIKI